MKNRIKVISSVFWSKKINIASFLLIGFFTFFLAVTAMRLIQKALNNQIESLYDNYGEYVFRFENCNESEISAISSVTNVKEIYSTYFDAYVEDNIIYTYISAEKGFFDASPYKIVEGRLPETQTEVAVTEYFLFLQGIEKNEMLGVEIELPFKSGKYTVSGIIKENTILDSDGTHYVDVVLYNQSGNSIAVTLNNLGKFDNTMHQIALKISDIKDRTYYNFSLVSNLYISDNYTVFDFFDLIHDLANIVILISSIIITADFSRMLLNRQHKDINSLRLIGVNSRLIYFCVFFLQVITYTIGALAGALLAKIIFGKQINVPVLKILLLYVVVLFVFLVNLLGHVWEGRKSTLVEKSKMDDRSHNNRSVFRSHILSYKTALAIKELRNRKMESVLTIASITIALSVIVVTGFLAKRSTAVSVDSEKDLKIQSIDVNGSSNLLTDRMICDYIDAFSSDASVEPCYYMEGIAEIDKNQINDKIYKYLYTIRRYDIVGKQRFDVSVAIVGKSGYKGDGFSVYKRNMLFDIFQSENNVKIGDKIEFETYDGKVIPITVSGIEDDIPDGMAESSANLIFVTSIEHFQRIFPEYHPEVIYVNFTNGPNTDDNRIIESLKSNPMLCITEPKTISDGRKTIVKRLWDGLMGVFIVFTIIVFIILLSGMLINAFTQKKEFAILMALGEKHTGLTFIMSYRLFFIYVVSSSIALLITYIATRFIFTYYYGMKYIMFYEYDPRLFMIANIFVLIAVIMITIIINKVYSKIDVISTLRV